MHRDHFIKQNQILFYIRLGTLKTMFAIYIVQKDCRKGRKGRKTS